MSADDLTEKSQEGFHWLIISACSICLSRTSALFRALLTISLQSQKRV